MFRTEDEEMGEWGWRGGLVIRLYIMLFMNP